MSLIGSNTVIDLIGSPPSQGLPGLTAVRLEPDLPPDISLVEAAEDEVIFTTRPRVVRTLIARSEGKFPACRCTTAWAVAVR
jgi:hypothetical protein